MGYIILGDEESNTFVEIIEECYKECIQDLRDRNIDSPPEYYQISDKCLEFIAYFGVNLVTYRGYPMTAVTALDTMLKEALQDNDFTFQYNNMIVRPYQTTLFDEEEILK